jgi:hypothetical protein
MQKENSNQAIFTSTSNLNAAIAEGDPFDLEKLRLSQNFSELAGVKKALLTIPVRKPNRQEFIRVHPSNEYHLETAVLVTDEDKETYLVDPALWSELTEEITPMALFTTINRQGVITLWPIKLPKQDGRLNEWSRSQLEAVEISKKQWVRVVSNTSLKAYEVLKAVAPHPDPEWPDKTFKEILEVAFKDRFIRNMDHPAILLLKGGQS